MAEKQFLIKAFVFAILLEGHLGRYGLYGMVDAGQRMVQTNFRCGNFELLFFEPVILAQ